MRIQAKRMLRILPFAIGVVLVCYIGESGPRAEPRYAEQPLHYWLSHVHDQRLPAAEQEKTRAALVSVGTNNLKLLLEWFREPEPSYSEPPLDRLKTWLLLKLHRTVTTTIRFQPSRPSMAFMVFTECPRVAEKAIPEFVAMLADKNDETKGKAAIVLAAIGRPTTPSLLMTLSHTNEAARALATWILGNVGTNMDGLLPWLEPMLHDKAASVRLNAAVTVEKLGGSPGDFIPVILRCISEGDEDTKLSALDCIGKMKDRAKPAVPDLTNSLAVVTNTDLRYAILSALKAIDPEEASKFDEAQSRAAP